MPIAKIQVKKIEDPKLRRVTLSKRSMGLFKKVNSLSILCDAQVGVIVFSEANDLTHFPDKESFDQIIEKYNTQEDKTKADLEKPPLELNAEEEVEKKGDEQEVERLRKKCDEQELIISQMDCNKEFGNLSMEELNQIEKRMQNGLNLVREKQREHNKKTIAQLQEHSEKTIAELQHRIQLMEEKGQQKKVLPLFPENGSSRKHVTRFRFNANANS